jgi:hypothetical protein
VAQHGQLVRHRERAHLPDPLAFILRDRVAGERADGQLGAKRGHDPTVQDPPILPERALAGVGFVLQVLLDHLRERSRNGATLPPLPAGSSNAAASAACASCFDHVALVFLACLPLIIAVKPHAVRFTFRGPLRQTR